jgi:hypothetical protein
MRIAGPAWGSFAVCVVLYLADLAQALPWPRLATRSLCALFLLAAITRVAADVGMRGQKQMRHAIAGVALTATCWFAASAALVRDPALLALAFLHIAVSWFTVRREPDPAERERGWLIFAAAMSSVSLMAIAALPAQSSVPGAPVVPLVLAAALITGGFHIARGRMAGLALVAAAALVALVLAARVLSDAVAALPSWPPTFGRTAPLLAATTALGSIQPIIALGLRLPTLWRLLAPRLSPRVHAALAWLTLPALAAVAVAFLVPH